MTSLHAAGGRRWRAVAVASAMTGGPVGTVVALLSHVVRCPLTIVEALAVILVVHTAAQRWLDTRVRPRWP